MATLNVALKSREAEQDAKRLQGNIDRLTVSVDRMAKAVDRGDREMKQMSATSAQAGAIMQRAFAFLASGIALRNAIRTIASFEQQMSELRAVTDATSSTMRAFEAQARTLGAATRFSATEAAEGMTFLARAGFDANEVVKAIGPSLNLAAAGSLSLGEAADFASNILSQFNLEAAETARVADVLVATSNNSNTNVRQLAEAMKFAGPVAGALGREIEETAAAIGVLGDSGLQASMAGTNLRQIMVSLIRPTRAGQEALAEIGLTMADLDPRANTLADVFTKLRDSGFGASEAVRVFSARNAAAALILTRSADRVASLTDKIDALDKASERAAQIMSQNLVGAWKELVSAAQEFLLQSGDKGALGALTSLVQVMTEAVRIFTGGQEAWDRASLSARALAIAADLAVDALLIMGSLKVINGIVALGVSLRAAATQMTLLQKTAAAFGVILVGWDIGQWLNSFESLRTISALVNATINTLIDTISDGDALAVFGALTSGLSEGFNAIFANIERSFDRLLLNLKVSLGGFLNSIGTALSERGLLGGFAGDIANFGGDLQSVSRRKLVNFDTDRPRQDVGLSVAAGILGSGGGGAFQKMAERFKALFDAGRKATGGNDELNRSIERMQKAYAEVQAEIDLVNSDLQNQATVVQELDVHWSDFNSKLFQTQGFFRELHADSLNFANFLGNEVTGAMNGVGDALAGIATRTVTVSQAFSRMTTQIQSDLIRLASRIALSGIGAGISDFFGHGGNFSSEGTRTGTVFDDPSAPFRVGVPLAEPGPRVTAAGGADFIASGPRSGFSAPLTLHGSERVRVTPMGGGGASVDRPVVNIYNQSNSSVSTRESNDGRSIEVMIEDVIVGSVRNGGRAGRAINETLGTRYQNARRG